MLPDEIREADRRGWSMVPVRLNKKPYVAWAQYQTTRAPLEQLEEWQEEFQPAGWAVITGAESKVNGIDFDGEPGLQSLSRMNVEPHIRSGSGGRHLYVDHP